MAATWVLAHCRVCESCSSGQDILSTSIDQLYASWSYVLSGNLLKELYKKTSGSSSTLSTTGIPKCDLVQDCGLTWSRCTQNHDLGADAWKIVEVSKHWRSTKNTTPNPPENHSQRRLLGLACHLQVACGLVRPSGVSHGKFRRNWNSEP